MEGVAPWFAFGPQATLLLLCAAGALVLVVWVLVRGDQTGARRVFVMACGPLLLAVTCAAFMQAATEPEGAAGWARRAIALAILGSAGVPALATDSALGPGSHAGRLAIWYFLAVALAAWVLVAPGVVPEVVLVPGGFVPAPSRARLALLAYSLGSLAWAGFSLGDAVRRARPGLNRQRLTFLLTGALACAVAAVELGQLEAGIALRLAPFVLLAGMSILAYVTTEALPRGQGVLGTIAWTCASAVAFVPVYGVVQGLRRFAGWSRPAASAAVLVGLFVLLSTYFQKVQPRIDRLFRRGRPRVTEEVAAFAARALDLRTPAELARDLDALLVRLASLRLVGLYLHSADQWIGVAPDGRDVPPLHPPLDPTAPVARWLARQRAAIPREGPPIADEPPGAVGARGLAAGLGADALVPLVHKEELIGIVAVSADGGLGRAELSTLSQLRGEIAVAALNAALYERARRMSAGLEQKVRARQDELTRAAQQLAEAQRRLVQQEKMSALGLLASGVGHQIGEALNFIGGNLPNLRRYIGVYEELIDCHRAALPDAAAALALEQKHRLHLVRKDAPALVSAIEEGTRRARGIAADLRRFAAPEEAEPKPVDLRERLDATLNLLHGELKNRARVHKEYHEVPKVLARGGQLDQVWMNLLVNAIQAVGEQGDLWISIDRDCDTGGEPVVVVTIADSGPGVPKAIRDRIFEPFFTTKPVGQGTGLGLAISYGIVERHGGRIELVDTEKGATFRVRIPSGRQV